MRIRAPSGVLVFYHCVKEEGIEALWGEEIHHLKEFPVHYFALPFMNCFDEGSSNIIGRGELSLRFSPLETGCLSEAGQRAGHQPLVL